MLMPMDAPLFALGIPDKEYTLDAARKYVFNNRELTMPPIEMGKFYAFCHRLNIHKESGFCQTLYENLLIETVDRPFPSPQ